MMSRQHIAFSIVCALIMVSAVAVAAQPAWHDIGRAATPAEIRAWDIDVRADFKGLPPGSGSVARGQEIWEAKCASCHGVFGEATDVFAPIAGGTTREDVRTGRVANLVVPDYPQRSTLMKLSQVSTLWDYIYRAMPWNAPKTLTVDEVYAVTAYVLSLADIVPPDHVLSHTNIAQAQARLPNRNGMVRAPSLWDVRQRPDVQGDACMKNCADPGQVRSSMPDYARNQHGNLAEQNRGFGATRPVDTTQPPGEVPRVGRLATAASPPAAAPVGSPADLAREANCLACHGVANRMVGPSFKEVADKYRADTAAQARLVVRVRDGGQGVWGQVPMPPNAHLAEKDLNALVRWILAGAQ